MTDKKTDFYTSDGKINPRGSTKNVQGVWLPRTRKHRYAYILDNNLECLLSKQDKPLKSAKNIYDCCNGTFMVEDKRFNKKYSCPICTERLKEITD